MKSFELRIYLFLSVRITPGVGYLETLGSKFMKDTIWDQECCSWYKNNSASGKVTALWTGSTLHYLEAISQSQFDGWDFKYSGNRFAYLGNGYSQMEMESTSDWAYYIRNEDDSPVLGRAKWLRVVNRIGEAEKIETFQVKVV